MTGPKMTRMRIAYLLESMSEPEVVTIHNRTRIAWDDTRAKRKWPAFNEAPFKFQTFLVWRQLVTDGNYSKSFDEFEQECCEIEPQDEEQVNPTSPATAGG